MCATVSLRAGNPVGVFETDFKQVPFVFFCQKFFSLILPKKHCLITQNRFWQFFGVLSGFLGVPRTIYFGGLSLYFDDSLGEKRSEVEIPRQTACCFKPSL